MSSLGLRTDLTFPLGGDLPAVDSVEVISSKALLVVFPYPIIVDENVKDTATYRVASLSGGPDMVIRAVSPPTAPTADQVLIYVSYDGVMEEDSEYSLSVVGSVWTTSGYLIGEGATNFTMRKTKVDQILGGFPILYSTEVGSKILTIMQAVGREDDRIGG